MKVRFLGFIMVLAFCVSDVVALASRCTSCRPKRETNVQYRYKKQQKAVKKACASGTCPMSYSRRKAQVNAAQKRAKKRHQRRGYRTQKQMDKTMNELVMKVRTMETTLANLTHNNGLHQSLKHQAPFFYNELR